MMYTYSMTLKNGFTLIELLIVIAILGILSVIGLGSFHSARIKAKDATRKSDLQTIAKSLEAYVNDHSSYPLPDDLSWGEPFVDANGTIYAARLPSDPSGYTYVYTSDGTTYTLYAYLENAQDPAIISISTPLCGTPVCNYLIKSSNKL